MFPFPICFPQGDSRSAPGCTDKEHATQVGAECNLYATRELSDCNTTPSRPRERKEGGGRRRIDCSLPFACFSSTECSALQSSMINAELYEMPRMSDATETEGVSID